MLKVRAERAVSALREPSAPLARVPNTIRQSFADIIEEQQRQIDQYGLALMMIGEGCTGPVELARRTVRG